MKVLGSILILRRNKKSSHWEWRDGSWVKPCTALGEEWSWSLTPSTRYRLKLQLPVDARLQVSDSTCTHVGIDPLYAITNGKNQSFKQRNILLLAVCFYPSKQHGEQMRMLMNVFSPGTGSEPRACGW